MAWRWQLERADSSDITAAVTTGGGRPQDPPGQEPGGALPLAPATEGFPTQSDAESWLGEAWRDLLAAGVDQVRLFEDGSEVYGPMSLHAPD